MIYQIDHFCVHLDLKYDLFLLALLLQLQWPKPEDSDGLISSLESSSVLGIGARDCPVNGGWNVFGGIKSSAFFFFLFTKRTKILP